MTIPGYRKIATGIFWALLSFASGTTVAADCLKVTTDNGPPHMIQATGTGIDIDIVREALQVAGYCITLHYAPLSRAKANVISGMADITVPTFQVAENPDFYLSDPIIAYHPLAFTRAENTSKPFTSLEAVKGQTIMTFQGARGYFGADFIAMTKNNTYLEIHDMSKLPQLLYRGRADMVFLDRYIFQYYVQQHLPGVSIASFQEHVLIPETLAHAGFHDKETRDAFNIALKQLVSSGQHSRIISRYIH